MRWGLIPSWAKDMSGAAMMINARSETAATKPAFCDPLTKRRCLIPADGFYEWRKRGKTKQPYCFEVNDGELFAFAGLWDRWKDPNGQWLKSCSILTRTMLGRCGATQKSMIGIPWRVAMEMAKRKWVLRSAIIWHRKHALTEAVIDRPRRSYENIFMFAKDRHYFFNRKALKDIVVEEDVWTIPARPRTTNGIDTAPFPDELVERCLEMGCPNGGKVLDCFAGSGTTVRVAVTSGRSATGIDLNPAFCQYMVGQLKMLL
jgi:hypothetical protein